MTLRAALYARRSTEEHQRESIATQVENATAYARAKRWTVTHTFTDEGVSGAEFVKRPGLAKLLAACAEGEVDAVIVRDLDRIGRDTLEVPVIVRRLGEQGVAVWCYATDAQVRADDPLSAFIAAATSFARDMERHALVSRIKESLRRKAKNGLVAGGDVYGYGRERRADGVHYVIDEAEAEVVREIYERRAQGDGLRTILRHLNARRIPSPRAGSRGTGSWSVSVLQGMLSNERYRGVLLWGRTGAEYAGRTRKTVVREDEAVVRVVREDLRIVSDALWERAQARTDKELVKRGLTIAHGKPKFLLAGLAKCAVCGGPIRALHRRRNKTTIRVYGCAWRDERGPAVCTNSTRRPVEACEDAILQWFRNHVLDDKAIAYVLHRAQSLLAEERAKGGEDPTLALAAELAEVEREVARLTQAVVAGAGAVQTIVEALTVRDRRAKELRAEIARVRAESAEALPDWPEALSDLRARLASLREEFRKGVDEAREVLRRFLVGPILFAPVVFGPRHHRFQITGKALGGRGLLASLEAPDQSPSTARGTSTTRATEETQAFLTAA